MSAREAGSQNAAFPEALPCYSVDTEEEARDLIVTVCRLQYSGDYVVTDWKGGVDEIFALGDRLEELSSR